MSPPFPSIAIPPLPVASSTVPPSVDYNCLKGGHKERDDFVILLLSLPPPPAPPRLTGPASRALETQLADDPILALTPAAQQAQWKTQASEYMRKTVKFLLDGAPPLEPVFEWTFTTHENVPLKNDDDVVVLTGKASLTLPPAATGFSIEATKAGSLSVILRNVVRGTALERFQVLFPSETSYILDFKTWQPRTPPPAIIVAPDEKPAKAPEAPSESTSAQGPVLIGWFAVLGLVVLFIVRIKRGR